MKKILSFFIVGLILVGCSEKDTKKTDWEKDKLKGKVKSITEIEYNVIEKFGEVERGSLIIETKIKYNQSGNKIEKTCHKGARSFKCRTTYEYDRNGNLESRTTYDSYGSLNRKSIYKHIQSVNKTELSIYNSDGSLVEKEIIKYYDNGKIKSETSYSPNGSFVKRIIYDYDENETKKTFINDDTTNWYYDSPFRIYKYDESGDEIDRAIYLDLHDDSPYKYVYNYEQDSKGNWIKRIGFEVKNVISKAELITEREIEYYD